MPDNANSSSELPSSEAPSSGPSSSKASLTDRTSRAAVWSLLQTAMAKGPAFLQQIILGRLLLREDFGLYGLAMTAYTFAGILHQAGVQEIVIKRQKAFRSWANPAFWLSLFAGLAAMIGTMLAAPAVARFYNYEEPDVLVRMIRILAITFPIASAGAISRARLQIDLRFKTLAIIGSTGSVCDLLIKVALALLGFGAFSFAYGLLIVSVIQLVMCWRAAPPPIKFRPQFGRMRYLLSDSAMLMLTALFVWMIEEGDYVVLGAHESVAAVGVYFMAFKITRHTMMALTFNFSRVLFPALSSLPSDEEKRVQAFVRAARLVVAMALPCCVTLSAVADPFMRIAFEPKWYGAIPLIQIMGIGMAMRTVNWPAASLLRAQGRFGARMYLSLVAIFVFFPMTVVGTRTGGVVGLAFAVAGFHIMFALVELAMALGPGKRVGRDTLRIFMTPIVGMVLATLPAIATAYLVLPRFGLTGLSLQIAQMCVIMVLIGVLYVASVRVIDRPLLDDFIERIKRIRKKR